MKKYLFNLSLHDEEGTAATGQAEGPTSTGDSASNGVSNQTSVQVDAGQGPATQDQQGQTGQVAQPMPEDLKGLFAQYPQYQKQVEKLMQGRVRNSTKENQALQQQINQMNGVMSMLYARYNVNQNDFAGLTAAISNDHSYLEAEAEMRGMTVEQLVREKQLLADNMRYQNERQYYQEQMQIQAQQAQWRQEEEAIKQKYPGLNFSFENEIATSPQFEELIRSGVPMEFAFQCVHEKELNAAREEAAIEAYKRQEAANKKAGIRPQEAGAKGQQPIEFHQDFSKMSDKEILAYAEKAGRR